MQALFGIMVLIIACATSGFISYVKTKNTQGRKKYFLISLYFLGVLFFCYLCIVILGAVIWGIAWLGIQLREIIQWCIEAVAYPFMWLVSLLF